MAADETSAARDRGAPSQSSSPLVSIVMPTYNRGHMVSRALDAVLAQTYTNLELIVVNDGSGDDTQDVLARYADADRRVRVINKPNEGIPDTVNRGFREATGDYVTWTSDDNYYHPEAIAAMVEFLEANPDTAFVYTDCRYIDGEGEDLGVREAAEPESLEHHCAPAGCLLFRRSVFEEVDMFRREWVRCHDFDFYHRVYKKFRVARLPRVLYDYRCHEESMSGDHVAHVLEYSRLMASYAEDRKGKRAAWAVGFTEIARTMDQKGRMWQGVWHRLRAALCEPSRCGALWDSLWRTSYGCLPKCVKRVWRGLKGMLAQPADPSEGG